MSAIKYGRKFSGITEMGFVQTKPPDRCRTKGKSKEKGKAPKKKPY